MKTPIISAIAPTANRGIFVPQTVSLFVVQDYPNAELLIIDDGTDPVHDLLPPDPRIRYIRLHSRHTIGAKRNIACREARGDIILHWDDDDWYAPWRISYQVNELLRRDAQICGLDRLHYYEPKTRQGWEYVYTATGRPWVAGNTLCYRKSFWQDHPFPEIDVAEDSQFVWQAQPNQVARLEDSRFIVAMIHDSNVSPKITSGCYWHPKPASDIYQLLGDDTARYHPEPAAPKPTALVAASRGLGDILRVTPLVRVLHQLGYAVDLLLEPDYPETIQLIEGAPEVRRVFHPPGNLAGLTAHTYDVAATTFWSLSLASQVRARKTLTFDRNEWLREGDSHQVEKIARALGFAGPMPAPFAAGSGRHFDLPHGTVAIHTGCKPDWPWKKWHGFDELATQLPHVALIGTPADLDNAQTYFAREFRWPAHVLSFIGKLDLKDTAALLSQCSALVANDSGIMHLGVALGIPTYGIFGITSPRREAIPAPNMFPVTKGLDCEPACRTQSWGRRDCEHHLECLKSLTPGDVLHKIQLEKPAMTLNLTNGTRPLGLTYYGHIFDASGYGNASRAYIHALHSAGVDISAVDLSGHAPQVRDPLVESLAGKSVQSDFHLFHGIPHVWANRAFSVRNAIAMTVWETDTMPTQWRNTLNHALEVWLPCDFNVAAFRPQLRRPIVKLPHPVIPRPELENPQSTEEILGVAPEDFLVYSIFEWQDRKSPELQLEAFLRAFADDSHAAYLVKVNPGAEAVARTAIAGLEQRVPSKARLLLRAEGWDESKMAALHARGDCYLSLHRGEGWGYPLFEAACQGVPVVATAFSGPLEYLDSDHHQLVSYSLTPVRQPYLYYHSRMQWAEPHLEDAVAKLQWVFQNRQTARHKAQTAARTLRLRYSLEEVGFRARNSLLDLLDRTNPQRSSEIRRRAARLVQSPSAPIPGSWYDADYFEHGIKSNWAHGYRWTNFHGLFHDLARFLANSFPSAHSFLDAGCAKGFLVKALRELGKDAHGFDSSPWAIQHAEPEAVEFVTLATTEDYGFDRDWDMLLAFDLFSQLSTDQIDAFLIRARKHVKVGLLVVIPVFDSESPPAEDRDLSHITRKPLDWWNHRFREAGWRQDCLHAALLHMLSQHDLTRRMGWNLFLFAPGS